MNSSNESLRKLLEKIKSIYHFASAKQKNLKPMNEVIERCQKTFDTRSSDFSSFLLRQAAAIVKNSSQSASPVERSPINFLCGDPGNGKTSAIKELAACTDVPICIIESKKGLDTSVVEYVLSEISRCYREVLVDEFGNRVSNGIILVDDLDQTLNNESKPATSTMPTMGVSSSNQQLDMQKLEIRDKVFKILRSLGDSGVSSFPDLDTGYPINISNTQFFITGNSVPVELTSFGRDQSIIRRINIIQTDYPDMQLREKILHNEFEKFKSGIDQNMKNFIEFNKIVIENDLNKILRADKDEFQKREGQWGVVGLRELIKNYQNYLFTEFGKHLSNHEVKEKFDVALAVSSISAFNAEPSPEIKARLVEKKINEFKIRNHDAIANLPETHQWVIFQELDKYIQKRKSDSSASTPPISHHEVDNSLNDLHEFINHYNSAGYKLDKEQVNTKLIKNEKRLSQDMKNFADWLGGKKLGKNDELSPFAFLKVRENQHPDLAQLKLIIESFGLPSCDLDEFKGELIEAEEPELWSKYKMKKTFGETVNVKTYIYDKSNYGTDIDIPYNNERGMYIAPFKSQGFGNSNDEKYIVFNPLSVNESSIKGIVLSKKEFDQDILKKRLIDWLSYCRQKWNENESQFQKDGIVIWNIPPKIESEKLELILNLIYADITDQDRDTKKKTPKKIHLGSRDKSKITFVFVARTKEHNTILSKFTDKSFTLSPETEDQRKFRVQHLVEGISTQIKDTSKYKNHIGLIMKWDEDNYNKHRDSWPSVALENMLSQFVSIVKTIENPDQFRFQWQNSAEQETLSLERVREMLEQYQVDLNAHSIQ